MNNDLTKNLTTEHTRHGEAVGKAIEEFKAIDEFEKAIDGEQADHLTKCMKAIDDNFLTRPRSQ